MCYLLLNILMPRESDYTCHIILYLPRFYLDIRKFNLVCENAQELMKHNHKTSFSFILFQKQVRMEATPSQTVMSITQSYFKREIIDFQLTERKEHLDFFSLFLVLLGLMEYTQRFRRSFHCFFAHRFLEISLLNLNSFLAPQDPS